MKIFATTAYLFVLSNSCVLADTGSRSYKSGGQIGKVLLIGMAALVLINFMKKKKEG